MIEFNDHETTMKNRNKNNRKIKAMGNTTPTMDLLSQI